MKSSIIKSGNPKSWYFRLFMVCLMIFFHQYRVYSQIQQDSFDTFKLLTYLPEELNEISGMVLTNKGLLAINDGGNPAELIAFSPENGQILNRFTLNNATNKDWEAITIDEGGWIYIADIGNNENKRKDLCIYVVHKDSIENAETAVRKISFRYADQTSFPPPPDSMWYDAETALIFSYGLNSDQADSLWIITKNRTEPFDGKMYVYALPLNEGDSVLAHLHNAKKYTNGTIKELEWITDAFFDRYQGDHGVIAVSSLKVFRGYYEVVQGRPKTWWGEENPFEFFTNLWMIQQFEAITWTDPDVYNRYWVTCEASPFGPAALYELHYSWVPNGMISQRNQSNLFDLNRLPNGDVQVSCNGKFNLRIYSLDGKLLDEFEGKEAVILPSDHLKHSPLLIQLMTKDGSMQRLLH